MRNGSLYLLFRVGNLRTKSNIIETHVTAKMVYPRREATEKQICFDQEELKVIRLTPLTLTNSFIDPNCAHITAILIFIRYLPVLRMITEVSNAS